MKYLNRVLTLSVVCFIASLLVTMANAQSLPRVPLACDADNNGSIDRNDITIITAARNTNSSGPADPRDPNRDGVINVLDSRFCTTLCTLTSCAAVPVNPAPVANAGRDQWIKAGAMVQLDGTASSSARGDALTYQWSLLSNPTGSAAVLSSASDPRPTFVADLTGAYQFQLIVTDAHAVASAASKVFVSTNNLAPLANAGKYATAHVGDKVALDATRSIDINGDSLSYCWQFVLVPSGSNAYFMDSNGYYNSCVPNPNFTVDLPGQYYLNLTVNDSSGAISTANVVIDTQVRDHPPIAQVGLPQWATKGLTVVLDGSKSSDPDGDVISAYHWTLLARPAGSLAVLGNAASPNPTLTLDQAGDYVAQLVVTANGANSTPITSLITTRNVPPIVVAGQDQTAFVGDTVYLHGTPSDANGDPLTYLWSLSSSPLGYSAPTFQAPDTLNANFAPNAGGLYVAQLLANDGHTDSAPDTIRVQVQVPTTADLSVAQSVSTTSPVMGFNVTFTVTATNLGKLDADGVSVSDLLPSGYRFAGTTATQGTYDSVGGTWSVGHLAKNGSATLTLTATVQSSGGYTNTATISAASPPDPNPANNSASITVVPLPPANLKVISDVSNATPVAGTSVTFTINVKNSGPANATAAVLAELLGSGYQFVSATTSVGTYNSTTGQWTIGNIANGATATLTITATVLSSGTYTSVANVSSANTPTTPDTSTSSSTSPQFPPTVSITSPTDNARFIAPASFALKVSTASQAADVVQLSIFDGATVIDTVPVNSSGLNFTLNLSGVSAGDHTYSASATDSQGLTTNSSIVHVSVVAPTAAARLLAPTNNSFYVAPATITLLATAGTSTGAVSKVEFFQNGVSVGTAAKAPYSVTLTGVPSGTYSYTVAVTDSTSTVTSSAAVVTVGGAASLSITSPVNGSIINDAVIATLSGTIQAPPNSSVTVAGVPATITPDGRFFVNNVSLQTGANSIQVVLTTPAGTQSTQVLNITSSGPKPFRFGTNTLGVYGSTHGLGSLSVEFSLSDPGQAAATRIDLSCSNNGTADYSITSPNLSGTSNSLGRCIYPQPGVYTAAVSVINAPNGQPPQVVYSSTQTIVVADNTVLDAFLRSAWSGMNDALNVGDQTRALNYLDSPAQDIYGPAFSELASSMPTIVASYSDLQLIGLSDSLGEYLVTRNIDGVDQGFLIYFVNVAGTWELDSM